MPFALRNILLRSAAGLVLTAAGTSVAVAGAATTPTARSGQANHGNPTVYLDLPPGDGGGAPDIFLTTVGNTAGGVLRFSVVLSNRSSLSASDFVGIFIDADLKAATGFQGGFEYLLQAIGTEVFLGRWDGSRFALADAPSLRGPFEAGQQFEISTADLGNTTEFLFFVETFIVGNDEVFDDSPNGTEVWRYAVRTPHINGVQARFAPRAARAGSRFRLAELSVRLDSEEDVQPTGFSCSATLGRKRLRGGGAGGCSFALPRTARRKLLKIVITVAFADQTKTVTAYSARVR